MSACPDCLHARRLQENEYILLDESTLELPPEDELQAAIDESMAVGPYNSTAW